jgi:hypothetical protein
LATSIPSSFGQAEVEDHQVRQERVRLIERATPSPATRTS